MKFKAYEKPVNVSGEELAEFLAENGHKYSSMYFVDPTMTYQTYVVDHSYDRKRKFYEENKIGGGKPRSAFYITETGELQLVFRAEKPDDENLVKAPVQLSKDEQEQLEKQQAAKEKKQFGNARVIESKEKIAAVLTDEPQTAEQITTVSGLSYATVGKLLGKMVEAGVVTLVLGVKEGAPGKGRHYKKV